MAGVLGPEDRTAATRSGIILGEHTPPSPRRRGRPQRLPDDPHPIAPRRVGCDQRIAWLLTAARVLGPDPDLRGATVFIAARSGART